MARLITQLRSELGPGSRERHFVVRDGQVVSQLIGDETHINTGGIPDAVLAGATTIHQHPGPLDWPISENDIVNALATAEALTLVVSVGGLHSWASRHPDQGEEAEFGRLFDRAESIEARAAAAVGWTGGMHVPADLLAGSLLPAIAHEVQALARDYPQFVSYRFEPWPSA